MRRLKDRKDARRIDNIDGLAQISIDLKPNRSVSDVFINQKMDVTKLMEYLNEKKKTNEDLTFFHVLVTAIGKTIYNRPKLNRFVANRHLYEHNDVIISFVAKVSFDDHSEEMMILIPIDKNDNIDTISAKIKDKVSRLREKKDKKVGANSATDVLGKLPNIIRVPIVGLLKWCDKKGMLPSSLMQDNIYYSSIILSNLGSIHCGAIFHNINDFGACSSLATIGEIKDELIVENGKQKIKKLCEFGINLDERIADGYYFAKSVKLLQYIFDNPEILEESASKKIKIEELR